MKLKPSTITQYVEKNIGDFHQQRYKNLFKLKFKDVLKRKNPYLFKAKSLEDAHDFVKNLMDAHLSSNEETIFGDWLEGLAIYINKKSYGGWKSGIGGIDLEFDKENIRYIVNIKSGPNWGNSSQIKKLIADFNAAKRTLKTSNSKLNVVAVNGCCYGKSSTELNKHDYYKYCGQVFWKFISGEENLYLDIIKPLEKKAKEKNKEFLELYIQTVNKFTREFLNEFCLPNGSIDWDKILILNSAEKVKKSKI